MQAVRARLAALREMSAHSHGSTIAHETAEPGPAHQSSHNTWQWADWGHGPGAETPLRSVGRRPAGPGDAFQGQSLTEVLSSGRSRAPETSPHDQDAVQDSGEVGPPGGRASMRARRHGQTDSAMADALDSFGGMSLGELMPSRRVAGRDRLSGVSSTRSQHRRGAQRMTAANSPQQQYRGGSTQDAGDAWLISAGQNSRSTDSVEDVPSGPSTQHGLAALALLHKFAHAQPSDGSSQGDTEDVQECSICLDAFKNKQILRRYRTCGHTFHERCIRVWLERGDGRCPYCRGDP